ncbi:unnamed protein product [Caretta caretta]
MERREEPSISDLQGSKEREILRGSHTDKERVTPSQRLSGTERKSWDPTNQGHKPKTGNISGGLAIDISGIGFTDCN